MPDPDAFYFRELAENHTDESPVDLSGREGAPTAHYCYECEGKLEEGEDNPCDECAEAERKKKRGGGA